MEAKHWAKELRKNVPRKRGIEPWVVGNVDVFRPFRRRLREAAHKAVAANPEGSKVWGSVGEEIGGNGAAEVGARGTDQGERWEAPQLEVGEIAVVAIEGGEEGLPGEEGRSDLGASPG